MQKTFLTSFSSIPWPRLVHYNCIQTKIWQGKQVLFKNFSNRSSFDVFVSLRQRQTLFEFPISIERNVSSW